VLAFLDRLCAALLARDAEEIRRLLRHPLANALTRRVREEALAIAGGGARGFRAPIHALQLYHQTAHLLGAMSDPATSSRRSSEAAPAAPPAQTELQLDAIRRAPIAPRWIRKRRAAG
jgi:hypothetical protein